MKFIKACKRWVFLITLFFSIISVPILFSQNKAAKKWFDQAIKARQVDEKITLFQKAIALDPSYTEAYYELGVLYEQKQQHDKAMHFLGRALFSRPTDLDESLRLLIVFEIGKIQHKLGKYRESNESLAGALNLAKNKTQRIEVLTELSQVLLESEDFDKAVVYLQELSNLDPRNTARYQSEIERARRLKEIARIYQEGVEALRNRQFKPAISSFEQVIEIEANYKDVKEKLAKAQQELNILYQKEKEFQSVLAESPQTPGSQTLANEITSSYRDNAPPPANMEQSKFTEGMEHLKNKHWDAALKAFEIVLSINPNHAEAGAQLKVAQDALENAMQERILSKYYNEGLAELRRQNWVKAIISFEKVLSLNPRYRRARRNLKQAQAGLEQTGTNAAKKHYYEQGKQAVENKDWILAATLFNKLIALDENYQDVKAQMEVVSEKLAELNTNSELVQQYQAGENYLREGKWLDAILAFKKVKAKNPNFQDVEIQLQFAQEQYDKVAQQTSADTSQPETSSGWGIVWSIIILVFILALVGLLILNNHFRGRVLLLIGQHDRATKLYERLLNNGSISDQLCLALLHLYLLENRRDSLSIKVYERALRLHLINDPKKKDEVSAIVTRHYLGRWENEAQKIDDRIEALLKTEIENGNND